MHNYIQEVPCDTQKIRRDKQVECSEPSGPSYKFKGSQKKKKNRLEYISIL